MKTDERFACATIKFLRKAHRQGGVVKAGIIAELMGISGRLV